MITNDSGLYQLVDDTLSYRSEVYGSWALPVYEITLIGEYTNEDGPFADDYFIVFLAGDELGWLEGSRSGEGVEEILQELSLRLGTEISCGLANSTTFASRVIWPEEKNGDELFAFRAAGWFMNRQVLRSDTENPTDWERFGAKWSML